MKKSTLKKSTLLKASRILRPGTNMATQEREAETTAMLKSWDVVKCGYCGKEISMLNAKLIDNKYFVCKGH